MNKTKTEEEIRIMRQGGKILHNTLQELKKMVKPGIACKKINEKAGELLANEGARPSFLNYQGFPDNLCVSLNDELVHGISESKTIKEGDLISLDLGVEYRGLFTDAALSFVCGEVSETKEKIIKVCKECLSLGIKKAKSGKRVGDIGEAIQEHAEKNGYSVVRKLVGHGVGYAIHEDPRVPNYGKRGKGEKLEEGMCLAIEPMICEGGYNVYLGNDGWTFATSDGKLSCHFEDTVVVRKNGGEILT